MDVIKDYVAQLATEKQSARDLIQAGTEELRPLNDELASQTAASEGVVLFGFDNTLYPDKAAAIISPDQKYLGAFGRGSIAGRFVELSASTLGDETKRFSHNLEARRALLSSRMNTSEHMVWTYQVPIDKTLKAVAQLALNPINNGGILGISQQQIEGIFALHHDRITAVTRAVSEVPIDRFNLSPAITPNAYTIRWDIRESTRLATGKHQGKLIAYKRDLIQGFRKLLEPFDSGLVDAGDGQNIVLYLPDSVQHDDTTGVHVWGRQHLPTLLQEMQEMQHALATTLYPELNTTIRLSVDVGHVIDQDGVLDGDGFSLTAKEMKQRPSATVTYTERASFLETNGRN